MASKQQTKKININFDFYAFNTDALDNGKTVSKLKNVSNLFEKIYSEKANLSANIYELNDIENYQLTDMTLDTVNNRTVYHMVFSKLIAHQIPSVKRQAGRESLNLGANDYVVPKDTHLIVDPERGILLIQSGQQLVSEVVFQKFLIMTSIQFKLDKEYYSLHLLPVLAEDSIARLSRKNVHSIRYKGRSGNAKKLSLIADTFDNQLKVKVEITSPSKKTPIADIVEKIQSYHRYKENDETLELHVTEQESDNPRIEKIILSEYIFRISYKFDCPRGNSVRSEAIFSYMLSEYLMKADSVLNLITTR